MKKMTRIALLLVSALFLSGVSLAQAASVEYLFEGTVTFDGGDGNQLGEAFNVWVTLDRDAVTPSTEVRFDIGSIASLIMGSLLFNTYDIVAGEETIFVAGIDPVSFAFDYTCYPDVTQIGTAEATIGGITYKSNNMTSSQFSSVPIPGAIWLLGSSMFGLLGFRKKSD